MRRLSNTTLLTSALRAIALALHHLRLCAIALALRHLRLRAIALALRHLRLRAIALALRHLRLRAIALALRHSLQCKVDHYVVCFAACRIYFLFDAKPWPSLLPFLVRP